MLHLSSLVIYILQYIAMCMVAISCLNGECVFSFTAQVIKNPVTDHLPAGSLKIGTSYHSEQIVDVRKFAEDKPIVFVIGAMAHGKV